MSINRLEPALTTSKSQMAINHLEPALTASKSQMAVSREKDIQEEKTVEQCIQLTIEED